MEQGGIYVGIDVAKALLDVAMPPGEIGVPSATTIPVSPRW